MKLNLIPLLRRYWRTNRLITRFCLRWYGTPFALDHYYSPLPNVRRVKERVGRWFREGDFSSIAISTEAQERFLVELEPWRAELGGLPDFDQIMREGFGLGYGLMESRLLHMMIRRFKPKRIIEVGSGVSTRFALHAAEINRKEGASCAITCIEPHPRPKLKELAASGAVTLLPVELQDADPALFHELGENDILFIDSTHAGKIDSDVYCIYLEILPRLKPGVLVHIHDITFPYLTTPPDHPLFDRFLLWNETALVKAFLSFNRAFEILVCQSWLHFKAPEILSRACLDYDRVLNFPGSLWLRRAS